MVLVSVGFVLYFAVHAVLHVNVRAPNSLACVTVSSVHSAARCRRRCCSFPLMLLKEPRALCPLFSSALS